jgi:CHAT domain-containing protein
MSRASGTRCAPFVLACLALAACRIPSAPSPELNARIFAAESLHLDGNFDSARALWRGVLTEGRTLPRADIEARALTGLGLAAYRTGEYTVARDELHRALQLQLRHRLDSQVARVYNALGLIAGQQGRLVEAEALYDSSLTAARLMADTQGVARALGNLGLVRFDLGDFDGARRGFESMRDAGRSLGDTRMHANALNNLGMLDVRLGNPGAALDALAEARDLYRSIEYRTGEQNNLGQLATAFEAAGDLGSAFAALDTALALSRELGLRQEEASNLEVLASLHRSAGDMRRAVALLQDAQLINVELDLGVERGTNARNRAELQRDLGRHGAAEALAVEALEIHRSGGARYEELHDRLFLADLSHVRQRSAEAAHHLGEARRLAHEIGARAATVHVAIAEARMADRDADPGGVFRALAAGPAEWEVTGFAGLAEGYALRARAHGRADVLDSAIADGRRAVAAGERLRAGVGSIELRARLAALHAVARADLVGALVRRGNHAEAFEVADAARGRTLLERLESGAVGPHATGEALGRGEELLRQIGELVARRADLEGVPLEERDSAALLHVERRLTDARSSYEALAARAHDLRGVVIGGRTSLAAIQAALGPDEVLLEYLLAPDRVHLFAVSRRELRHLEQRVAVDEIVRRTRHAHQLLAADPGRSGPSPRAALAALHAWLIQPAIDAGAVRPGSRLITVAPGALGRIPFGALYDAHRGRWLAEDHAMLQAPSAAALVALRSRPPGTGASRVSVLAPDPRALPGTAREAEAVARAFETSPFLGAAATESRLRGALAAGGLVHVAAHGLLNERNPMFSRIELHPVSRDSRDDGRLEVHELFSLRLASDLVFLSGCETARVATLSPYEGGDEYSGLAQALQHAGIRNVIATAWRIEDRAAARFAERFYEHLARAAPAEALAAAQRDLLRSDRWSDPRFWASYQLSGDGYATPAHSPVALSVQ